MQLRCAPEISRPPRTKAQTLDLELYLPQGEGTGMKNFHETVRKVRRKHTRNTNQTPSKSTPNGTMPLPRWERQCDGYEHFAHNVAPLHERRRLPRRLGGLHRENEEGTTHVELDRIREEERRICWEKKQKQPEDKRDILQQELAEAERKGNTSPVRNITKIWSGRHGPKGHVTGLAGTSQSKSGRTNLQTWPRDRAQLNMT